MVKFTYSPKTSPRLSPKIMKLKQGVDTKDTGEKEKELELEEENNENPSVIGVDMDEEGKVMGLKEKMRSLQL